MPRSISSVQAKAASAKASKANSQTGNRWNMSRWNVTATGSRGVSLFEALGISKGTIQWPQFAARLPMQVATSQGSQGGASGGNAGNPPAGNTQQNQALGKQMAAQRGWTGAQWTALNNIVMAESGWSTSASNPSGAYGIPQSLPGSKMASAGSDWRTNPRTQITWMLDYIRSRYGTPQAAWQFHLANGWY